MNLLVTGATGNVGRVVLQRLIDSGFKPYAGVRDTQAAKARLELDCHYCVFDLEKELYPEKLFDAVFLLRPPHLATSKPFKSFLKSLSPVTKVVFLSVQGADKKTYLPHAKIEKLITELGLKHIFLRPSYFMENLTTTLWPELLRNKRIFLPSAGLKFNWIAISDIAEVAAIALTQELQTEALELCTDQQLGFQEIITLINALCGTRLSYESPSLFRFLAYSFKQRQGLSFTLVMLLLHYLPRFSKGNEGIANDLEHVTGKPALSMEAFIRQSCQIFEQLKPTEPQFNFE